MPTLYSDRAAKELPTGTGPTGYDTWSRDPGVKGTGDVVFKDALYTINAAALAATGDVLRICKLPAGVIPLTHLCKIFAQALGTAFNIAKIGLEAVDGTTADNDDDKLSLAINPTAGGRFDLADAAVAGALAAYITPKEMWVTATLGTVTAPTVGQTIRFAMAFAAQS